MRLSCDACQLIDGGERKAISGRIYDGRAFFVLTVNNPLRRRIIDVVESDYWGHTVLIVVLANCVTTAVKDPLSPVEPGWYASSEWFFTSIFTVEMVVRMLAMGATPFESAHCYWSEGWNCLDGFIVLSS